MDGDREDSVGPAGVRVHQRLGCLSLVTALLEDGVHLVLVVHLHLLKTLRKQKRSIEKHILLFVALA